ncbi:hypothetical protein [Methanobacterium alcaliphilum]|uniref:hypothetical protein n=1 Tax=Methanobacterium alcaliphilum TaxID=392018 RepID=UPI00200B2E96|nr:hypothetical protein [Methanobacterium alcaliphilum]MCK9152324.1 hypothetical protein [Methanobacterium alcaliphilum]
MIKVSNGGIFDNFNCSKQISGNYNNTNHLINDNERIFEYTGNGTFWVGVIKDTNNENLKPLLDPFEDDKNFTNITKENITVNGHQIVFEVHTMEVDLTAISSSLSYLSKNNMKNGISRQPFAKFQAKWHCNESNLTFVFTGFVPYNKIPEMKQMIKSIKCHSKKPFILF